MHAMLNQVLVEEMNAGRRFILVIDEAQNLDEKVLESVRLLSNFETPWKKLIQIVIAGQPQLAESLARPSMAQLRQRISSVIRLEPFTPEEVNAYISHRLWIAGTSAPVFTVGARLLIAEHSARASPATSTICASTPCRWPSLWDASRWIPLWFVRRLPIWSLLRPIPRASQRHAHSRRREFSPRRRRSFLPGKTSLGCGEIPGASFRRWPRFARSSYLDWHRVRGGGADCARRRWTRCPWSIRLCWPRHRRLRPHRPAPRSRARNPPMPARLRALSPYSSKETTRSAISAFNTSEDSISRRLSRSAP